MRFEFATEFIPCALCGGRESEPLGWNDGLRVVRCRGCSLVFVNPQPTEAAVESYYSSKELTAQESWSSYFDHTPQQLAALWTARLADVARWTNGRSPRLLDIGCGWGDFLHFASARGWQVGGFEFSASVARVAQEKYGLAVRVGSLEDMEIPDQTFDLITLWHVLEHLRDPLGALARIEPLLAPGGVLVLEVPNLNFLARKSWRYPMSRTLHLYHFSPATLSALVERAGLRVLECRPGHTGYLYKSRAKIFAKKSIYAISGALHQLAGVNVSDSIRLYACRREDSQ